MSKKMEILAVDDSKMNHKVIARTLSDHYELSSVFSGQACLDRLSESCPDLILLDVTMPDMDGFETCEKIKSQPEYRDLPVLFLSGRCSIEEKVKGYEVGADDYITKPFVEEELLAKIKKNITFKLNNKSLSEQMKHVAKVTQNAVAMASSIDACMRFLGSSLQVKDIQGLADLFFEYCRNLGLSTTLRIRLEDKEVHTYFEDGIERELEVALLSKLETQTRFIAAGRRVIINFQDVTVLIKNMPNEKSKDYEMIRNFVLTLVEALELRLKEFYAEDSEKKQKGLFNKLKKCTHSILEQSGKTNHQLISESGLIVEDIVQQMEAVVPKLNLDEYQEKEIFRILGIGLDRIEKLHSSYLSQEEKLAQVVLKLNALDGDDVQD